MFPLHWQIVSNFEVINMGNPLVTIIIPVYNTETWLKDCLNSVLEQDYQELEIFCVNDGSTDHSAQILAEYAARDQRIQIIDQENRGPGYTRNHVIDSAAGKYILCLDSDDMLAAGFINILVKRAEEDKLDMLCYDNAPLIEKNALQNHSSQLEKHHAFDYPGIWDGRDLFAKMQQNDDYYGAACFALYRREWLNENNIRFLENCLHEDEFFIFCCFLKGKRCGYLPEQGYLRRLRIGSIMTVTKSSAHITGIFHSANYMFIECFQNREQLVNYPEFYDYALHIKHTASYFYRQNEEKLLQQPLDGYEKMMYEDLANYGSRVELEAVYNSNSWKIGQAVVNPLNSVKNTLKQLKNH